MSSVLHRESVCQVLFHGVHLLLPNKTQKRLTASSLMLATGCHCSFRRFRPFWLCVPIFRRVCLFLRHCAWILNYCTISCIGVQLVWYTIRAIKTTFRAAIWWISPFNPVRAGLRVCFLFPLGAVLMRGNAGALTEGHNEVRSTGETAVICDGLNTLRGGEQLLFGGAQTHSLQKLMRCCRLVLLKLTHIVAGAARPACG